MKRHYDNSFSTSIYHKKTVTGLYTKWDSFTPQKIIQDKSRLHLPIVVFVFDHQPLCYGQLWMILRNFCHPHSTVTYNLNDVISRHQNRPKDPVTTVPRKEIFIVLPFLGFQSKVITQQVKSCIPKLFPFKDRFNPSTMPKVV